MRQLLSALLSPLFLVLTLFLSATVKSDPKTITFVADVWPPFNDRPNAELEGYMIDVARAVFEKEGYNVEYRILPWNRAIIETRKGRFNAIIGATKNEASDFIFPKEELGRSGLSFYVRNDASWRYDGEQSLKDVYLGVIDGYDYNDWFVDYQNTYPEKVYVRYGRKPLKENVVSLVHGRLDVIAGDKHAVAWVAKQAGLQDRIRYVGRDEVGGAPGIYHAFSPNLESSKLYSQMLSKGIEALRSSGELQRLLDKYDLKDWK